ncbi:DNA primase [bacterium]|nr:DNA primase [bacterium]
MPSFSQEYIERVKTANPIQDVIGERVALTKNGKNFKACCPFHNEKTPSFFVTPDRGIFKCFGCGKGGNVFQFLMEYEGLSFPESVIRLAERANIPPEDGAAFGEKERSEMAFRQNRLKRLAKINLTALDFFQRSLALAPGKEAREYLSNRQVSSEAIRAYRIGFAPDSWDELCSVLRKEGFRDEEIIASGLALPSQEGKGCYDRFRKRVMFPIWDHASNLVAFGGRAIDGSEPKYLNTSETEIYAKSKVLFSLNFAKSAIADLKKTAILCEGYLDVVMLAQNGFVNAIASCGTSLTKDQSRLIKRFADTCLVAYDGDSAGQHAALRAIPLLSEAGLKVYVVPLKENEDPDSFLKKYGKEAFEKLITERLPAFSFAMRCLSGEKDMNDLQERYSVCQEMFPYLMSAGSEGLRQELIKELSDFTRVPVSSINLDFAAYQKKQKDPFARAGKKKEEAPELREESFSELKASNAEKMLIALIFSFDDAMDYVFSNLELEAIGNPLPASLAFKAREDRRNGEWRGVDDFLLSCDDVARDFLTDVLVSVPLPQKDNGHFWKRSCDDCIRAIKGDHYRGELSRLKERMKMTNDPDLLRDLLEKTKLYNEKLRRVNRVRTFNTMAKERKNDEQTD